MIRSQNFASTSSRPGLKVARKATVHTELIMRSFANIIDVCDPNGSIVSSISIVQFSSLMSIFENRYEIGILYYSIVYHFFLDYHFMKLAFYFVFGSLVLSFFVFSFCFVLFICSLFFSVYCAVTTWSTKIYSCFCVFYLFVRFPKVIICFFARPFALFIDIFIALLLLLLCYIFNCKSTTIRKYLID